MTNLNKLKEKALSLNLEVVTPGARERNDFALEGKNNPKYSVQVRKPKYIIESFCTLEDLEDFLEDRQKDYENYMTNLYTGDKK